MENEIRDFWQSRPCGAHFVGDLEREDREEYEDFFRRYDEYRYTKEGHILTNLDRIDFDGKRVLEIGLGQGSDSEQIILRGGIYNGIDLTDESVKRVRMRFALKDLPFERVERASVLDIPFEDNSIDIVFSHGVLHHVPDIKKAQAEIARVLKPDGRLIVMLFAKNSLNYRFSISIARRLGLLGMYALGINAKGIYGDHLKNAHERGLWNYLSMKNFISVNTVGPFNLYSKVYDEAEIEKDFEDFALVSTHKEFMHAPPLPVRWMPLSHLLGWHLWAELTPIK